MREKLKDYQWILYQLNLSFKAYDGALVEPLGEAEMMVYYNNIDINPKKCKFLIVKSENIDNIPMT